MPARTQELAVGVSFNKQAALQTALAAGSLWSLATNQFNPTFPQLQYETDAEDFGKGDEWVANIYPTSLATQWEWPYFLTSENFCQAIAFALGDVTKTSPDTGAYQYECVPLDPVTDGVDLEAMTLVGGLRQGGAGEILDIALIGMVCDGFSLRLTSGTGRQNSQLTSRWVGCGKYTNNSGITIPAATTEHRLGAGGVTALTINSVNYLANARFVDLEFQYNNNVIVGYYPGSGSQSGFDIAGRMRIGRRTASLVFTVELESDSDELANLLAGTEGTATITNRGDLITGSTYHQAGIVLHKVRFSAYQMGESDGFVTARVTAEIMKHSSNGVMTLTGICEQDGIMQAAA